MPQLRANGITLNYDEHGPKNAAPLLIINGYSSQMTSWPDDLHEAFVTRGFREFFDRLRAKTAARSRKAAKAHGGRTPER